MSGRVLVVGSYNTDLVAFGPIPRVGETVIAERFASLSGGKGSNQAIAAARQGAAVTLCGRVGADAHGEEARHLLESEGIACDALGIDATAATGVAVVLVDQNGDNAITVAPGANARLEPGDISQREALFSEADVLLVQLEIPLATAHAALELGRRHGCINVLDPAPAQPLASELLALVDVLTPNQSEARLLAGCAADDVKQAAAVGRTLLESGSGRVILTLGAMGSVLVDAQTAWHTPAPRVSSVDTTGAGDAFNGGLAAALATGSDWLPAVQFATRVAAASVQREGVVHALPRPKDLADVPECRSTAC
jgi:ribokinase